MPIDSNVLKAKAPAIAEKLNVNKKFKVLNGWLQNFKIKID